MKYASLLIIPILSKLIYCKVDTYQQNYGLYRNVYNNPNYDTTESAHGYQIDVARVQKSPTAVTIPLIAISNTSFYGQLVPNLVVQVDFETSERLHVKIYDKNETQVQVPDSPLGMQRPRKLSLPGLRRGQRDSYRFQYTDSPFGFQVIRTEDNTTLFNTSGYPIIFEDQYLEISSQRNSFIYGAESNITTIFQPRGHQPFHLHIQKGYSYGVFLLNAHGMDIITVDDRITYKAIGGVLDFYFFVPPDKKPHSVVQAYTSLVGRSFMPDYWMLGSIDMHRIDQKNDSIEDSKIVKAVESTISVNEPVFKDGQALNIFVKNPDGSTYIGQTLQGYAAYIDWWHSNVSSFWSKYIGTYDGVALDMNYPSSFCLGSCGSYQTLTPLPWQFNDTEQKYLHALQESRLTGDKRLIYPRYTINNPAGNLSEKTVMMTAKHQGYNHYDVHNLNGHASGYITSLSNKLVVSRSTFIGSGRYMGHWITSKPTWESMKSSIRQILRDQMYGISYSGADIACEDEELCARWISLASLYPFFKSSNNISLSSATISKATQGGLVIRHSLLPYLYTLFEESHRLGTGVWRPTILEYPTLNDTLDQFLIGTDILLSPVIKQGATTVNADFPLGLWYNWYDYDIVNKTGTTVLDAPITRLPLHIRGGSILTLKTPQPTVNATLATPFHLLIALNDNLEANGRLYVDDEHGNTSSINFVFSGDSLIVNGQFGAKTESIANITMLGSQGYNHATLNAKVYPMVQKHNSILVALDNDTVGLNNGFNIKFSL